MELEDKTIPMVRSQPYLKQQDISENYLELSIANIDKFQMYLAITT